MNGDLPDMSTTAPDITLTKDNDTLTKEAIIQGGAKQKEIRYDKPKQLKEPASEFMDWYYR